MCVFVHARVHVFVCVLRETSTGCVCACLWLCVCVCVCVCADYIPPIDVSITIAEIDDVDLSTNEFFASFMVQFDWEDPSL